MNDLIAKLEAASEGSADLDRLIADAIGWDYPISSVPRFYTTSLDAALTLVPAGLEWLVRSHDSHRYQGFANIYRGAIDTKEREDNDTFAATPALALCIAALKARQP